MTKLNKETFKVTNIQFFDQTDYEANGELTYAANVTINNQFIIEVSGNEEEANGVNISECAYINEKLQVEAIDEIDCAEVVLQIEAEGFENNWHYLNENATERD